MKKNQVSLRKEFVKQAYKSIFSIFLFIISYIIIVGIAISLAILCVIAAGILVINFANFMTIILGLGLGSLGILVLYFLLQFLFKVKEEDKNKRLEINKNNQPELFKIIEELVKEIGVNFPKKVYLTNDVNASVFYESSFWSMFLPVKKNLQIGLGLINTSTKNELKAILAHEFGHFSQSSMKLGSYVYNLNYTVYNLIFDSSSYDSLAQKWAGYHGVFTIFVKIADIINSSISIVLKYLFSVLNKSYYGLSREMEFHADEIAANLVGTGPLKSSLLRLNFSATAFNEVYQFYNFNNHKGYLPINFYENHLQVLFELSSMNKIPVSHNLPNLSLIDHKKFDKSKLIIKDQWASHPTIEERINRLDDLNLNSLEQDFEPAISLINDKENILEYFTNDLFAELEIDEVKKLNNSDFLKYYKEDLEKNSFPKIFNSYYDDKNPVYFEENEIDEPYSLNQNHIDFFSEEKVAKNISLMALINDIHLIKSIANDFIDASSFDYDGKRYSKNQAKDLYIELEAKQRNLETIINENDKNIFAYFRYLNQIKKSGFLEKFHLLLEYDKSFPEKVNFYNKCFEMLSFTGENFEFEDILSNFKRFKPYENQLKNELRELLNDKNILEELKPDDKNKILKFLDEDLVYFGHTRYLDHNLKLLFNALQFYYYLISRRYFFLKKDLLITMAHLIES